MVEWFWWDSNLILTTNRIPSVLWHCWFGHLACKNRLRNDLLCVEWDVKPYTLAHSLYKSEYFSDQMTFWVLSSLYCRTICLISLSDVFDLKNPQRASHVMLSTGIIPLWWSWSLMRPSIRPTELWRFAANTLRHLVTLTWVPRKLRLSILESTQMWLTAIGNTSCGNCIMVNYQATSQDPSVHTDLTWRHQRLCILGLYRRYRNAVLLLLLLLLLIVCYCTVNVDCN